MLQCCQFSPYWFVRYKYPDHVTKRFIGTFEISVDIHIHTSTKYDIANSDGSDFRPTISMPYSSSIE